MQRSVTSTVLLFVLSLAFTRSSPAQATGAADTARRAAYSRSFVENRGAGNKVKVKLLDGTKVTGRIVRVGDNSFELITGKGRPLSTISFDDVAEIEKAGWSGFAKLALGIGIGAAAAVAVLAITVANTDIDGAFPAWPN